MGQLEYKEAVVVLRAESLIQYKSWRNDFIFLVERQDG